MLVDSRREFTVLRTIPAAPAPIMTTCFVAMFQRLLEVNLGMERRIKDLGNGDQAAEENGKRIEARWRVASRREGIHA